MKLYVAGPMTGYDKWNFPAFDAARNLLIDKGHSVRSPADIDRVRGFDPCDPMAPLKDEDITAAFLVDAVNLDVAAIQWADGVYFIRGWEKSTGARGEWALAVWLGKKLYYQDTL